jgi:hypothetical protein
VPGEPSADGRLSAGRAVLLVLGFNLVLLVVLVVLAVVTA